MISTQRLLKLTAVAGLSAWIASAGAAAPSLNLSRYRGTVVYLDFWASWCAPCKQSFSWLKAMQQKYGAQGLTIVAVNEDKNRRDANQFLRNAAVHFIIVYDPKELLAKQYHLVGLPSSFLIDTNGNIYRRHLGFSNGSVAVYEREIRALLDKRTPSRREPRVGARHKKPGSVY